MRASNAILPPLWVKQMKYKVTHITKYDYTAPVSVCHNIVNLMPRNDGRVERLNHRLIVQPTPPVINQRIDVFGNTSHRFSIDETHSSLSIKSISRVQVSLSHATSTIDDIPWETIQTGVKDGTDLNWVQVAPFRFASPRIGLAPIYKDYTLSAFTKDAGIVECLDRLTEKIYTEFTYDPNATVVSTTVAEAFAKKRGVCQDLAHIQLACLRSLGIPARYVSGYLKTTRSESTQQFVGADQSHAWVSAYCGPTLGWIEFDPTNNCRGALNHIPMAWGRDYGDVVPVRGVLLGRGKHTLSVSVHVEEETSEMINN